jgi:hypothetical protein
MPGRSRSFDSRGDRTGSLTYHTPLPVTTSVQSVLVGSYGTCDDAIGNYPYPNGLGIKRRNVQYPGINGVLVVDNVVRRTLSNFPISGRFGAVDPDSKFAPPTFVGKSNAAWTILSKANPSAPDYSIPQFVAEMKDIPSMMKNWYKLFLPRAKPARGWYGGKAPKHWRTLMSRVPEIIASGHLTWRWAIAPFVDDVRRMLDFHALVSKRVRLLESLRNGKTIRRRVKLGERQATNIESYGLLHSNGCIIRGRRVVDFTEKLWGSVSYKLAAGVVLPKSNDQLAGFAANLVEGLTTYEAFSTAWELMPWSWLIDWFTGIGTVITASNNAIGLTPSSPCLMRTATSFARYDVDMANSDPWVTLSGEYWESYVKKERYIVLPALPFAPSYLALGENKAWSVLGSLAVLQTRPGRNLSSLLYKSNRYKRSAKRK